MSLSSLPRAVRRDHGPRATRKRERWNFIALQAMEEHGDLRYAPRLHPHRDAARRTLAKNEWQGWRRND